MHIHWWTSWAKDEVRSQQAPKLKANEATKDDYEHQLEMNDHADKRYKENF